MNKWMKQRDVYEEHLTAANRSTDYDAAYKKALKILWDGLAETHRALYDWQKYVPPPFAPPQMGGYDD